MPSALPAADLLAAFSALLPAQQGTSLPPAEARPLLQRLADEAAAAWPALQRDDPALMGVLARAVGDAGNVLDSLTALRPAELWLAHLAIQGNPLALALFDNQFVQPAVHRLARLRLSAAQVEDVVQRIRERLLVASAGAPPRLAQYSGRGSLAGFVSVTLAREGIKERTRDGRLTLEDDQLWERASEEDTPEVQTIKRHYGAQFKTAFQAAFAELPPRDKTLLRQSYLDGLSIDELGRLYGTHRATAARWLARIRQQLSDRTLALLRTGLSVKEDELESIMRLIQSNMQVSISRLLVNASPPDPKEDA